MSDAEAETEGASEGETEVDTPATEAPFDVPPPTADIDIADEEGVSQRLRLRAIHTAHDNVADARLRAKQALVQETLGEQQAREIYRAALESYLMEIEPLLLGHLDEPADDSEDDPLTDRARTLWTSERIGSMTVQPPERLVRIAQNDGVRMAAGAGGPQPKTVSIDGLRSILDLPSPLSVTWTLVARGRSGPHETQTGHRSVELRMDVLDEAFRRANEVLAEIGGWADFDAGRPLNKLEWDLSDEGVVGGA